MYQLPELISFKNMTLFPLNRHDIARIHNRKHYRERTDTDRDQPQSVCPGTQISQEISGSYNDPLHKFEKQFPMLLLYTSFSTVQKVWEMLHWWRIPTHNSTQQQVKAPEILQLTLFNLLFPKLSQFFALLNFIASHGTTML